MEPVECVVGLARKLFLSHRHGSAASLHSSNSSRSWSISGVSLKALYFWPFCTLFIERDVTWSDTADVDDEIGLEFEDVLEFGGATYLIIFSGASV